VRQLSSGTYFIRAGISGRHSMACGVKPNLSMATSEVAASLLPTAAWQPASAAIRF
jgi:hypothetical protein